MNSQNIQGLFGAAKNEGLLGAAALKAIDVEDLGAQIQAGLGVLPDDVQASEVTLVTMLIDDSGSIRFGSNAQHVREGHNLILDALAATKQKDGILVHCRYLNGTVLYPYTRVVDAPRMDTSNYDPMGGTPLFSESVVTLGTVVAKSQDFANSGIPCRSVTVIITDGGDTGGGFGKTAKDVAAIAGDLLKTEQHIIAAVGVDDGQTDFNQVFGEMGIPKEWILTPKNSASDIRKTFAMISQSAVRASQGAGNFSKTAMGGFGA